jgi:uncharacterized protein YjbI with pentapeptide repeats
MEIKDGRYQIESEDADLSRSAFVRVNLAGSSFRDVDLSGAVVDNVTAKRSQWSNVDLSGMSIRDANLGGASISESNTIGMTINGVLVTDLMKAYRAMNTKSE